MPLVLFLWAYGILVVAEVLAFWVSRASRFVGAFLAIAGPFVLVVLSAVSIGVPMGGSSWFGVPVPGTWVRDAGALALGPVAWVLVTFPIAPVVMIGVAIAIVRRRQTSDSPEVEPAADLADRYQTRAPR